MLHQLITQGVSFKNINYNRLRSIADNYATTADVSSEWARMYITDESINYAALTKDEANAFLKIVSYSDITREQAVTMLHFI